MPQGQCTASTFADIPSEAPCLFQPSASMLWPLMLFVPASAWVWHVARAARGREYPVASLAVAVACTLLVAVATRVVANAFYPAELALAQEFDEGRAGNTLTFFVALFAGVAMVPLELLVAGVWAAARAVRSRRKRVSNRESPSSGA